LGIKCTCILCVDNYHLINVAWPATFGNHLGTSQSTVIRMPLMMRPPRDNFPICIREVISN
jgi:hypothetical protein